MLMHLLRHKQEQTQKYPSNAAARQQQLLLIIHLTIH
jgi:hypothetical protein